MNIFRIKKTLLFSWTAIIFLCVLCLSRGGHTEEASATFPVELTGDQLYEQGLALCSQKKYQGAIPYFEEATKRKSNFCDAYYQLSVCYLETEQFNKAKQNAILAKVLSRDKSLKYKASKIPEEIEQKKREIAEEKAKLGRQERERIRLAQVEAERIKKEEMSNYLAALSENRRFLVTEIAKYYQGDQLKNTYDIAQLSEGRSDEEVQIILNNVRVLKVTQRTE